MNELYIHINRDDTEEDILTRLDNLVSASTGTMVKVKLIDSQEEDDEENVEEEVEEEDISKLVESLQENNNINNQTIIENKVSEQSSNTSKEYNPFVMAMNLGKTQLHKSKTAFKFGFHQILPKLCVCGGYTNTLLLNYGMGTGKTVAALNILSKYYQENQLLYLSSVETKYQASKQKKLYVVGEWQTKNGFTVDMLRPELGFTSEIYNRMYNDPNIDKTTNKHFLQVTEQNIKRLRKEIKMITYQGLFNLVFGEVDIVQDVDVIKAAIRDHTFDYSSRTLDRLRNSVIVVDEVHRMYAQGGELNSYGVALMEIAKMAEELDITLIYLTGTMFNGNPAEFDCLMDLIAPKRNEDPDITDYVSVSRNYLPNKILSYFVNEDVTIDVRYIENKENKDSALNTNFSNIEETCPELKGFKIYIVPNSNQENRLPNINYKIDFSKPMDKSPNSIEQHSNVISKCVRTVVEKLMSGEKCVIYSDDIEDYGIVDVVRTFEASKFVRYGDVPTNESMCRGCILPYKMCKCTKFEPIVYGVITGTTQMDDRMELVRRYNSPKNIGGSIINIMVLSSVAQSGASLLHTNNMFVISNSYSISKFLQTTHRIIRKNSHVLLPDDKQYVNLYVMTDREGYDKYMTKIQNYIKIKGIENTMRESSVFYKPMLTNKAEDMVQATHSISQKGVYEVINSDLAKDIEQLLVKANVRPNVPYNVFNFIKQVRHSDMFTYDLNDYHVGLILIHLQKNPRIDFYTMSIKDEMKTFWKETCKINKIQDPFSEHNNELYFVLHEDVEQTKVNVSLNIEDMINDS